MKSVTWSDILETLEQTAEWDWDDQFELAWQILVQIQVQSPNNKYAAEIEKFVSATE